MIGFNGKKNDVIAMTIKLTSGITQEIYFPFIKRLVVVVFFNLTLFNAKMQTGGFTSSWNILCNH